MATFIEVIIFQDPKAHAQQPEIINQPEFREAVFETFGFRISCLPSLAPGALGLSLGAYAVASGFRAFSM